MDIEAAVVAGPGSGFIFRTVQLDDVRPDEVRVAIKAAGICHTDLTFAAGVAAASPIPGVLGHEGAGVVERVGAAVTNARPGDRVLMSFDSCGECSNCRTGMPYYCQSFGALNFAGIRRDGTTSLRVDGQSLHSHFFGQSSLATHANVRARTLVPLPDDVPFEIAAPLGCGVMTGAGAVLNVLKVGVEASIGVIGLGGVGLGAVMAARLSGAPRIVAIDPVPVRRSVALDLGADLALDPTGASFTEELASIGRLTHLVDTVAHQETTTACFEALGPLGRLAVIGAPYPPLLAFNVLKLFEGRSVQGLTMGEAVPQVFVPALLDHWRAGRFPVERLISRFPLAEVSTAVDAMQQREAIKPVVMTS